MQTNEFEVNGNTERWTIPIDEEGVLTLPDELLEKLGWQEDDVLEFVDKEDGSFYIVKVNGTAEPEGEADS